MPSDHSREGLEAQRNAKRAEIAAARRKIALAYADVFGADDKSRTERQRLVWKNLTEVGFVDQTTVTFANAQTAVDPLWTHVLEGRRQLVLHVQQMVKEAAEPPLLP